MAHAFFLSDGRAHFDEDEIFIDEHTVENIYIKGWSRQREHRRCYSGTNLLWVASHEFGHSLGIHHSDVENAVMYPHYTGYVPNLSLQQDYIDAIHYLYGEICQVKMVGYWPSSFFACLWTETMSRSLSSQKRTGLISSHLDRTNLVDKGFVTWLQW